MSDLYQRRNPHKLYRDRDNAILAGVCAGLADYFGWNRRGVRVATAIGCLVFMPFVIPAYIILAILMPSKPRDLVSDDDQARFWRGVSNAPADVFGALSHRFRELDLRLQKKEAHVTSREFNIDRELNRSRKGN
jgi:phage shock protein C